MEEHLQVAASISVLVALLLLFLTIFLIMYCLWCPCRRGHSTSGERQPLLGAEMPTSKETQIEQEVPTVQVQRGQRTKAPPSATKGAAVKARETTLSETLPPSSTAEAAWKTAKTLSVSKEVERSPTAKAQAVEAPPRLPENSELPSVPVEEVNEWLSMNNFREVYDTVWDARLSWYELGVQLGLQIVQLNVIRRDNHGDTNACFRCMIQAWLNQEGATWKELISALKHKMVNCNVLANSIATSKKIEQGSTADTDKLVSSSTSSAENITTRRKDPEIVPLYSDSADTTASPFKNLNTSKLTPKESRTLKARLRKDTRCIVTHFSDLVIQMRNSFKQRNIDPRDLATTVKGIAPREALTQSLQTSLKLPSVTSIDTLVDQLQEDSYISFINYHLVEYMITHYGTDEDKMMLKAYETRFKEYCRRSVFEVPQDVFGSVPSDGEKLAFKVRKEVVNSLPSNSTTVEDDVFYSTSDVPTAEESSRNLELSLGDVMFIQEKVAETLDLDVGSLVLLGASRGCVELTFSARKVDMEKVEGKLEVSGPVQINLEAKGIHSLPGPPGKPQATKVRHRLHWTKPKYQCLHPILHYKIHYRSLHDPSKVWRTLETEDDSESIVLPEDVRPQYETLFIFKVQAVTHIGSGIDSEDSDPIMIQPSSAGDTSRYYTFRRTLPRSSSAQETHSLSIGNLLEIMDRLNHVKEEWYDVGLELGLERTTLDELKREYKTPDSCLRHMLTAWLQRGDATREALGSALNNVGRFDLSNSIALNADVENEIKRKVTPCQ